MPPTKNSGFPVDEIVIHGGYGLSIADIDDYFCSDPSRADLMYIGQVLKNRRMAYLRSRPPYLISVSRYALDACRLLLHRLRYRYRLLSRHF